MGYIRNPAYAPSITVSSAPHRPAQQRGLADHEQDHPAGELTARFLRLADGPDEVHRNQIAKIELAKYE